MQSKDSRVGKRVLYWLSENEFYSGSDKYLFHYRRTTKEIFDNKAASFKTTTSPQVSPTLTSPATKDPRLPFACIVCLDRCEVDCGTCGGRGRIKRRVERSKWDYYYKKYTYYYDDEWSTCSMCHSGKVKCTSFRCPCK